MSIVTRTSVDAQRRPARITPWPTASNKAGTPITLGYSSQAIAITPNGRFAYVVNYFDDTVSMIDTASNTIAAMIDVGAYHWAVAITP